MSKSSYLTRSWFSLKAVLVTVFIFFGAQIVGGIWFAIALLIMGNNLSEIDTVLSEQLSYGLVFSALIAFLCVGAVWLIIKYYRKDPLRYLGLKGVVFGARHMVTTVGIYFVYFVCLIIIMNIVGAVTPVDVNQEQELGISNPRVFLDYVQIFVMLAVIPPIFEEILFRGFLYKTLRKRLHIVVAGIITSLLFGIAHLEYENLNWVAAIDTMLFSGFLIYLVEKQKSLYGAMLLHALKNTIAFFVLFVYR